MGNEAGKGKYAKMDKVEVPNSSSNGDAYGNGSSRYAVQNKESNSSSMSKLSSLKQGINSGYHSIVLSPATDEKGDSGGSFQKEDIK